MTLPLSSQLEGAYEILGRLHEGGMGAIYKVRHRLLGQVRVIKVIRAAHEFDSDIRDRFLDEAKAAAKLRHPNIAQLYDFSITESGSAFMVMEFIEGVNLLQLLEVKGRQPVDLAVEIGQQTLRALAYVHRHHFVHRDISPDNLMLTRDVDDQPLIKLIDLGIAKPTASQFERAAATRKGTFLGKSRYASPEQLRASSELDVRSDLYSLSVVLYELLTGEFPIDADDDARLIAGHLFEPPKDFELTDPEGRVPAELRRLVLSGLEKKPENRPAGAADYGRALRRLAEDLGLADRRALAAEVQEILSEVEPPSLGERRPGTTQNQFDVIFDYPLTSADGTDAEGGGEDHASSLLHGAIAMAQTGRLEDARDQLRELLELEPGHERAEAFLAQVERRLSGSAPDELRARVEPLLEEGDLDAARRELRAARERGEDPEAVRELLTRLEELEQAERVKGLVESAMERFEAEDLEGARTELLRARRIDPDDREARRRLAKVEAAIDRIADSGRRRRERAQRQAARERISRAMWQGTSGAAAQESGSREAESEGTAGGDETRSPGETQRTRPRAAQPADRSPLRRRLAIGAIGVLALGGLVALLVVGGRDPAPPGGDPAAERPPAAAAPAGTVPAAAIAETLRAYETAWENLDLDHLTRIWPGLDGDLREEIGASFEAAEWMELELDVVALEVDRRQAAAICSVSIRRRPKNRPGQEVTEVHRFRFRLRRTGNAWTIEERQLLD